MKKTGLFSPVPGCALLTFETIYRFGATWHTIPFPVPRPLPTTTRRALLAGPACRATGHRRTASPLGHPSGPLPPERRESLPLPRRALGESHSAGGTALPPVRPEAPARARTPCRADRRNPPCGC